MVKSIKYILTRILIGVGIALALMFLKGSLIANVYAAGDISSASLPGKQASVSNLDASVAFEYPSNTYWVNWGRGVLRFNISLIKQTGGATDPIVQIRQVVVGSGNTSYVCDIGTSSDNNSTYTGTTYSVSCPMKMTSSGLTGVGIVFNNVQVNGLSQYLVRVKDMFTFAQDNDVSVQVDNSGVINGLNSIGGKIDDTNDKIDETNDKLDETNDKLGDIDDTLNDDSIDNDNVDDTLDDLQGQITSNGVITDLLLLPITLYQSILNSLNNSGSVACPTFSLGSLFGHNITLPCINLSEILGQDLYYIIDILCSGLMILAIRKKLVDIFNHMTSLNDRGNEVE